MDRPESDGVREPLRGSSAWMDRKRLVLAVRSVVVATAAYLAVGSGDVSVVVVVLAIVAFAVSHAALILLPRDRFDDPRFGPLLLLADSVPILACLSWSHGLSQDLILVYFFTVFLVSIGETIGQVAIGSALVVAMYGYWLWLDGAASLTPTVWVRLPFFFLVGVFYATVIEQLKGERRRRLTAEFETRQLRLLLDLAGAFSESEVTEEFVRGMGRFVEGACDGVRCRVVNVEIESFRDRGLIAFPLRSRGECFGSLIVDCSARGALSDREEWICQIVAHTAAAALHSAAQSSEAETAARAKDEFLATVSHEFRTPLHAILGYLEILDGAVEKGADPMIEESIERMRVNGWRLKNLLEELLTFAELRAGFGRVTAEPISLTSLIDELGRQTRGQVADKPVAVSWQVDADADAVVTDRRKLMQAIGGLLSNAAKFTEKGRIHVMARRAGDGVELAIADTGIGIASSDLALVFDDFRQVDGSFTRRYGGLGVGLPLVRELATLLGGRLEVESELGKGTTVRLLLPREISAQVTQFERRPPLEEEATDKVRPIRRVG